MSVTADRSTDVALAVAIVMKENACGADAAIELIQERATALGLHVTEVAITIVQIERNRCSQGAGCTPHLSAG